MLKFNFFKKKGNATKSNVPQRYLSETDKVSEELRTPAWLRDAHCTLDKAMDESVSREGRISYIRNSINSLVTEMQKFYLENSLKEEHDGFSLRSLLMAYPYSYGQTYKFVTSGQQVIACPWSQKKLDNAVQDIEREGYVSSKESTMGTLYKQLNMVLITNHNHHAAAVILLGQSTDGIEITGPIVDLAEANDIYVTDDFHFADGKGNQLESKSDPRFVLAVRLGQILGRIENED